MSVKDSKKREYQKRVKVFKQGIGGLTWLGKAISITSILLSVWASEIYASSPHEWYDIQGRSDILLLGLSLMLSVINLFIEANLWFIESYIGKVSTFKTIMHLAALLFPFISLARSLILQHELYIVPFATVFAVVCYNHYRSKPRKTKKAAISQTT